MLRVKTNACRHTDICVTHGKLSCYFRCICHASLSTFLALVDDKLQLVGLSDILRPPAGVVNSSGGRAPRASLPFCQLNGACAGVASVEMA